MPQAVARDTLGLADGCRLGPAAERHRPGLASGRTRAGIAAAHLRRPGPPAVRGEPDGTGWRFTGVSDWCTGRELLDLVIVAGATADDDVVLALLPARDRGAWRPRADADEPGARRLLGRMDATRARLVGGPSRRLRITVPPGTPPAEVVRREVA